MTDITIKRACEVLRAEGYNDAAQYLNTWAAMPSALRDVYPLHDVTQERKPSDIEVIAERLAKVEDLLSALQKNANGRYGETAKRFADLDQRLNLQNEGRHSLETHLNARIDKVAEIIGERVSDLVNDIAELRSEVQRAHSRFDGWQEPVFPSDDIAAVRDSVKRAHERIDDLRDHIGLNGAADGWTLGDKVLRMIAAMPPEMRAAYEAGGEPALRAAFPTGGAHTAEAAAEAVLPVPQRGDRVRLEGARGEVSGRRIKDGWYDVVGYSVNLFQIRVATDGEGKPTTDWLPWLSNDTPALKEVRHAQS